VFEEPVGVPPFFTDEAKVSQILRNFISNALKFTERGEVRVAVKLGPNDTAVFSVADTGIGVAQEDQERIFQEWTQVEGRFQKTVKGTGLGLPLSRKFAQLLGGEVHLKSQLGLGSTFYATIPITFSGATEIVYVPDVARELDATKQPVLVVEDNREALFIYDKYLKGTQFQVVPAGNLKEARSAMRDFRPAAVILDVLLQGEHSWEFLQELKRDPGTAKIPVMVVTVVENREKALALGADAFQGKPVERSWLLSQLDALVGRNPAKQVLVVDDDEISRYLIKTLLSYTDFRVVEAFGGQEGLVKARESKPDVVILDLDMPDLSGAEVLKKLKSDSKTSGIPVIIYTSKVLDKMERESLSDAVAILSKESKSREQSLAQFADAFRQAGVPFPGASSKEAQHA
jgi:CheY-like chemotaxis protein